MAAISKVDIAIHLYIVLVSWYLYMFFSKRLLYNVYILQWFSLALPFLLYNSYLA
jgi:hypothetical protein